MEKIDILSLSYDELLEEILKLGEKKFRAGQIYSWLHEKNAKSFDEITCLSKDFRNTLSERFYIPSVETVRILKSKIDKTQKFLYKLEDGNYVETVAMNYHHGTSLCISTQVGCKMGCRFCASAIAGFVRDLKPSEMLLQIYESERNIGEKIDSIVLMGIGEPLDNYDNVMKFFDILSSPEGRNMSLRHVTMSTCGIVPKINELAEKKLGITLSVSLHSSDNEHRDAIMPVNKVYNINKLINACRDYVKKTGRRVTFEYAVIEHVNSSKEDAKKLAELLKGMNCHVNLIPVNKVKERNYYTVHRTVETFRKNLEYFGVNATVRRTLGADIEAACGQLRRDAIEKQKAENMSMSE